jgi:NADH:ubiquinone oxidoreductase subunit 3 (subunit A)
MNTLEIIGLLLNFIGTLILTLPSLISTREFDEKKDKNTYMEENGRHRYTSERIRRDTAFNLIAMTIVSVGFIITLLGLFNLKSLTTSCPRIEKNTFRYQF